MSIATESMETLGESHRFNNGPTVSATTLTDKGLYCASLNADPDDSKNPAGRDALRKNSIPVSVDATDPAVKKVVYNLYRGLLGTYNEKANGMISSMPAERVREDQGIAKQVESMMRQSAEISGALGCRQRPCEEPRPNMAQPTGSIPPPPPPMPNNGAIPSIRLNAELGNTNHNSNKGGKHVPGGGAPFSYIPPAAIQNAMMSKDKKPFTYTPGGIDLSEIRSPRIQRRISKNAADEGVAALAIHKPDGGPIPNPPPLPPQALAAMQPQLAVPVFPAKLPPSPPVLAPASFATPATATQPHACFGTSITPPTPAFATLQVTQPPPPPPPPVLKSTAFIDGSNAEKESNVPVNNLHVRNTANNGEAPSRMFQQQLSNHASSKNSSPCTLSPRNSPAQSPLPDAQSSPQQNRGFIERGNVQVGSIYIPPVASQVSANSSSPSTFTPQLSKSPMPWMNSQNRSQDPSPPNYAQETSRAAEEPRHSHSGNVRIIPLHVEGRDPPQAQQNQQRQPLNTRVVPIQIEGNSKAGSFNPQPQSQIQQPYVEPQQHYQQQNQQYQQQQQQHYQQQQQQHYQQQQQQYPQQQHYQQQQQQQQQQYQQPPWRTNITANQMAPLVENLHLSSAERNQERTQPIQSRSFRILQMITDTQQEAQEQDGVDSGRQSQNSNKSGPPPVGERRLNLTQDDQELMDMFRSQVSEESSLHQEPDPRYRGSHIPSRAFRILQNFTDTSDGAPYGVQQQQPQMNRQQSVNRYGQQYPGNSTGIGRGPLPPSEQNVPEPRKYTGGSIPSRSFRMLQQMTGAEDEGAGQSDL